MMLSIIFEIGGYPRAGLWIGDMFGKIVSDASLNYWIQDGLASVSSLKSLDFLMPYLLLRY